MPTPWKKGTTRAHRFPERTLSIFTQKVNRRGWREWSRGSTHPLNGVHLLYTIDFIAAIASIPKHYIYTIATIHVHSCVNMYISVHSRMYINNKLQSVGIQTCKKIITNNHCNLFCVDSKWVSLSSCSQSSQKVTNAMMDVLKCA